MNVGRKQNLLGATTGDHGGCEISILALSLNLGLAIA
jgi:hypothetical protein